LNECSSWFPASGYAVSCVSEKPSTLFSRVLNPSMIVLSFGSSCGARASGTSIQRRLSSKTSCGHSRNSSLISSDCLYNVLNRSTSLSSSGSSPKSLTAVLYVKSPILERNSSVLSNGTKLSGNCPTFDNACDDKRHISTSCGESESLESIANDVPILSCNISIW